MFLDFILVLSIAIFAMFGVNKGVISSCINLLSRFLVFMCSLWLSSLLSNNIYNQFFKQRLIASLSQNTESIWTKIAGGLVSLDGKNLNDIITQSSNSIAITVENAISPSIINISVFVIFIFCSILLSFVAKFIVNLVDKTLKFPVTKTIDVVFGLIFGVAEGIIILLIVIAIIKMLPLTTYRVPRIFTEEYVNTSHIFKYFYYSGVGDLISIVK